MELEKIERRAMFKAYNSSRLNKPKEPLPIMCKINLLREVMRLEKVLNRLNKQ
ncbi:hypothetical protein LCGC14_1174720 [marine sediment metagenome]|uniref:Uncharacterized protein n=1 Tax=marine sediment metagenome TaxID=412755 RepID=A0A0F9P6Z9_9ZZZZ